MRLETRADNLSVEALNHLKNVKVKSNFLREAIEYYVKYIYSQTTEGEKNIKVVQETVNNTHELVILKEIIEKQSQQIIRMQKKIDEKIDALKMNTLTQNASLKVLEDALNQINDTSQKNKNHVVEEKKSVDDEKQRAEEMILNSLDAF